MLDLFSGAGGAAMGYHRAGWKVTGVDSKPMPRYPFEFIQGDALTDARLAYIVVGTDELSAASRRAETLRAVLAYSSTAVAAFPDDQEGRGVGVQVYRFNRPDSWEGLSP